MANCCLLVICHLFGTELLVQIWFLELFTFGCEVKIKNNSFAGYELKLAGKLHDTRSYISMK